jgi:tetratricopeptide (TPR) repeat protein
MRFEESIVLKIVPILLVVGTVVTSPLLVPITGSHRAARPSGAKPTNPFVVSSHLIDRKEYAEAIVQLRTLQKSRKPFVALEATDTLAYVLRESGDSRSAVTEYRRLLAMAESCSTGSRIDEGIIHTRIATLALDLHDVRLFAETYDDLERRQRGRAPAIRKMTRILVREGDIDHLDRIYEALLKDAPNPSLRHRYALALSDVRRPQAAFRVLGAIPKPYPKDIAASIQEELHKLDLHLAESPKRTEAQERTEAIQAAKAEGYGHPF